MNDIEKWKESAVKSDGSSIMVTSNSAIAVTDTGWLCLQYDKDGVIIDQVPTNDADLVSVLIETIQNELELLRNEECRKQDEIQRAIEAINYLEAIDDRESP